MNRYVKRLSFALAFAVAGAAALTVWPIGHAPKLSKVTGDASRGAYLARMSGCISCHTDKENNGTPLAGGLALKTQFGTFFSPNLTTDKEHGIGDWNVEAFAKAVRQGVSPNGKAYYPSFPYPFYSKFSDQDIVDLWAGFQTVPPANVASKDQAMTFPFNFRAGLKIWRGVFLDSKPFVESPEKSDLWNRGKFIVEGPAHCGACHTPRNFAGARNTGQKLQGTDSLALGSASPAITAKSLNEKGWTEKSLKYALKTGVLSNGDVFGGSMGEVVRGGTAFLTDQDLTAVVKFLLDQGDK